MPFDHCPVYLKEQWATWGRRGICEFFGAPEGPPHYVCKSVFVGMDIKSWYLLVFLISKNWHIIQNWNNNSVRAKINIGSPQVTNTHLANIPSYKGAERGRLMTGPWSSGHRSSPVVTWLCFGCLTTSLQLWLQHPTVSWSPFSTFPQQKQWGSQQQLAYHSHSCWFYTCLPSRSNFVAPARRTCSPAHRSHP